MKKYLIILASVIKATTIYANVGCLGDYCFIPLTFSHSFGFHINLTGQKSSDQKIFYNVTDDQGKIILANKLATSNSINFVDAFKISRLNNDSFNNQHYTFSKKYTLTVYGIQTTLPNGNVISTAIPIILNLNYSNLYATTIYQGGGGEDNGVYGYLPYGAIKITSQLNKNFKAKIIDTFNPDWIAATIIHHYDDYSVSLHKDCNYCKPYAEMKGSQIINVDLPYVLPKFLSIQNALLPVEESETVYFKN